jgi:hypothetical protein
MVVKHRLADASYWLYDHMRHRTAFEAASASGAATDFAAFEGKQYAALVTFRKDGTPVPTPVWFALLGDEGALDRKYGRARRVYERVMTRPEDMLYVEVVPAT